MYKIGRQSYKNLLLQTEIHTLNFDINVAPAKSAKRFLVNIGILCFVIELDTVDGHVKPVF